MKETQRILKLLEDGKITAEEAAKLLEALNKSFGLDDACCVGVEFIPPRLIKRMKRVHDFESRHKKVIVKMGDACCEHPEDVEVMAFGCLD